MSGGFPFIRVFSWDTAEIASPVGNRTTPGGTFAFKHIVSSGCSTADPNNAANSSGILTFEETQFNLSSPPLPSHLESKVAAITFNVLGSGTAISDLRLFVADDSAFQGSADEGLDRAFVQFVGSGNFWAYSGLLPSGAVDRLPLVVPDIQNVFRQDGSNALVGEGDLNSSEFIYLNLVIPLGTPLGEYGVCGSGLLRFGLTFNYWCNDFILEFGDNS